MNHTFLWLFLDNKGVQVFPIFVRNSFDAVFGRAQGLEITDFRFPDINARAGTAIAFNFFIVNAICGLVVVAAIFIDMQNKDALEFGFRLFCHGKPHTIFIQIHRSFAYIRKPRMQPYTLRCNVLSGMRFDTRGRYMRLHGSC